MINVFISHTHEDAQEVQGLKLNIVKKFGDSISLAISSDFSHGPEVGEEWEDWIKEKIRQSHAMVFFVTSNTKNSKYMDFERMYAQEHKKKIIPFVYDDSKIPPLLSRFQAIKAGDRNERMKNLITCLDKAIKEEDKRVMKRIYSSENVVPFLLLGPVGLVAKKLIDEVRKK